MTVSGSFRSASPVGRGARCRVRDEVPRTHSVSTAGPSAAWVLAPGTEADLRAAGGFDLAATITLGQLCTAISRQRERRLGRPIVTVPFDFEAYPAGAGLTRAFIGTADTDFVFYAAGAPADVQVDGVLSMLREVLAGQTNEPDLI